MIFIGSEPYVYIDSTSLGSTNCESKELKKNVQEANPYTIQYDNHVHSTDIVWDLASNQEMI